MRTLVDVSGFSFTGKTAVIQLLSEFENVVSHDVEFEFDFARSPNGIIDVCSKCIDSPDWSLVRSCEAIRECDALIRRLGGDRSVGDRLSREGTAYDFYFPGFTNLAQAWLKSLLTSSYRAPWPYANFSRGRLTGLSIKYLRRFGLFKDELVYLARLSEEEIVEKTQLFFDGILKSCCEPGQVLITNNMFEPYSPSNHLRFVKDGYSIVVDRDPRDIYLSAKFAAKVAGVDVGAAVTGSSVGEFVKRFEVTRGNSCHKSERVIRINFEQLIFDYETVVEDLQHRLPIGEHIAKSQHFKLLNSRSNVGIWKSELGSNCLNEVAVIEDRLSDYLFEGI